MTLPLVMMVTVVVTVGGGALGLGCCSCSLISIFLKSTVSSVLDGDSDIGAKGAPVAAAGTEVGGIVSVVGLVTATVIVSVATGVMMGISTVIIFVLEFSLLTFFSTSLFVDILLIV